VGRQRRVGGRSWGGTSEGEKELRGRLRQGSKTRGKWKTVSFHLHWTLFPWRMLRGFCFTEDVAPLPSWPGVPAQAPALPGAQQSWPHAAALGRLRAGSRASSRARAAAAGPLTGCCGKLPGAAQPQEAKAFVLVFKTLH